MFLDHTQRRSTVGRTPLDEWSARRRVRPQLSEQLVTSLLILSGVLHKVYLRTCAGRCQMRAHMSISIIHSHSTTQRHYLPLLNARVMNVSVRCHTCLRAAGKNISSTFSVYSSKHLLLNRKSFDPGARPTLCYRTWRHCRAEHWVTLLQWNRVSVLVPRTVLYYRNSVPKTVLYYRDSVPRTVFYYGESVPTTVLHYRDSVPRTVLYYRDSVPKTVT